MVKLTYLEADGGRRIVDARPGQSIMEAAVKNSVPGILADCGGAAACGTCRIYVEDAAYRAMMPARSAMEDSMIEFTGDEHPHVRLSCQIKITEDLDGMIVRMPESQHSA